MKFLSKCSLFISFLFSAQFVHAVASAAVPQPSDLDKVVAAGHFTEVSQPGIELSGYVDIGYIANLADQGSNVQGYAADSGPRGDFNVNQVKLVLQKPLSGDPGQLDAGFRVDLMLGEDAAGFGGNPGAFPLSADSLYMNNAYAEVNLPYANGINLIAGKWGSLLGFEADERVDNLNITQGTNAALDPNPGTGVLVSYPINNVLTLAQGVINGANLDDNFGITSAPDGDGYAFTGAVALTNPAGNAELQAAYHWGPWGDQGVGAGQTQEEHLLGLNLWGTWVPQALEEKWLFAFNTSFWMGDDYSMRNDAQFVTAALYSKYQICDWVSAAGRIEYTHDGDGQFSGFSGQTDFWGWTGTLGFHLIKDLLLRAEYRVDWGSDILADGDDMAHTIALQAVYSF